MLACDESVRTGIEEPENEATFDAGKIADDLQSLVQHAEELLRATADSASEAATRCPGARGRIPERVRPGSQNSSTK